MRSLSRNTNFLTILTGFWSGKGLKSAVQGVIISFWKIRQFVTTSNFDTQGAKSKPETRRLIWVVSQVIRTHGLAARAILVQENWNIFWFCGGFWKICLLVTTSNLGWEVLIWSVLVSAPHRDPGKVSSLKNKLSRAVLAVVILQSEGFWACSVDCPLTLQMLIYTLQ